MAKGTQQEEVDSTLEISGPQLAAVLGPILCNNNTFLKALANSPAFIQALLQNPQFCAAIGKKAASAAGPALTQGLGR